MYFCWQKTYISTMYYFLFIIHIFLGKPKRIRIKSIRSRLQICNNENTNVLYGYFKMYCCWYDAPRPSDFFMSLKVIFICFHCLVLTWRFSQREDVGVWRDNLDGDMVIAFEPEAKTFHIFHEQKRIAKFELFIGWFLGCGAFSDRANAA